MTSTDIGVVAGGAGADRPLARLTGTGTTYQDFSWNAEATSSFGAVNQGQTFEGDGDSAPSVSSSDPEEGEDVEPNVAISITFSEPVAIAQSDDIVLTCDGIDQGAIVTPDATQTTFSFTNFPLPNGASCSIVLDEAGITALTRRTRPMPWATARRPSPSRSVPLDQCAGAYLTIPQIQGAGTTSPNLGTGRTTEGLVTALFPDLRGFTLLDVDGDDDASTSDGIFVFRGPAYATDTPSVGDALRITGRVTEFQNQTEIDTLDQLVVCGTAHDIAATPVTLPETTNGDLERYEGMKITLAADADRAAELLPGPLRPADASASAAVSTSRPTSSAPAHPRRRRSPTTTAARCIVLDDATAAQNPNPMPYLPADGVRRAGDTVSGLEGILDEGPINSDTTIRDYRDPADEGTDLQSGQQAYARRRRPSAGT